MKKKLKCRYCEKLMTKKETHIEGVKHFYFACENDGCHVQPETRPMPNSTRARYETVGVCRLLKPYSQN